VVDRTPRAPFHELRIFQMNQAYRELLDRKTNLYMFSWGELFTGHLESLDDNSHQGKYAAALWGDMLLYYMSLLTYEKTNPQEIMGEVKGPEEVKGSEG